MLEAACRKLDACHLRRGKDFDYLILIPNDYYFLFANYSEKELGSQFLPHKGLRILYNSRDHM